MMLLLLLTMMTSLGVVVGDYNCVCFYGTQLDMHAQVSCILVLIVVDVHYMTIVRVLNSYMIVFILDIRLDILGILKYLCMRSFVNESWSS